LLYESRRKARRPGRPGLEALERREVPATFHAANLAQLQADLATVSNSSGPNTIIIAPGNYQVTSPLTVQNSSNLSIEGTTKKGIGTELLGNNQNRIFQVNGGSVAFVNMTIAGGGNVARGGGIQAQNANLTVKNSAIVSNTASQAGAGISVQGGSLLVTNSWIGNNAVFGAGNTFGGAIAATNAQVTVDQSLVVNNSAVSNNINSQAPKSISASGGAIYTSGGTLSFSRGTLANNFADTVTAADSAVSSGGAVASSNTTVTLAKSRVQNNDLNASGHSVSTTQGIAFYTSSGSLTVTGSAFAGKVWPVWYLFAHPNATVTVKGSVINGVKFNGTYTLTSKGLTNQA
jgi:hypothetical protein